MDDSVEVRCPWCGEIFDVAVPFELLGELIEDCSVCCRACKVTVRRDRWGDPEVRVEQE